MINYAKLHIKTVITLLLCGLFMLYCYGCEPKTQSILNDGRRVNRQELQLELDRLVKLAEIRMLEIEKQERIRALVVQNALAMASGQPVNPVGILTGLAAIYGISQGGSNIGRVVNTVRKKRKTENG